jgi:predicted GNAT family acetyltransferase
LDELSDVAQDGGTIVAAFDDTLPVAFAYVASETEALWDVSIETIESHRRRGYAAAAVVSLMHLMKQRGKTAVWGALASNSGSKALARWLGFVEVDTLWVLARSVT